MSVPEGKRSKGKLNIETDAFKFLNYIFDITTRYYQPPATSPDDDEDAITASEIEQAKWLAEKMRNLALDILCQIQEANKIIVAEGDIDSCFERRKHQDNAERSLENLLGAASIMYRKKKLKSKRLKNIGLQVGALKRKIQNWRKSDTRRYTQTSKQEE